MLKSISTALSMSPLLASNAAWIVSCGEGEDRRQGVRGVRGVRGAQGARGVSGVKGARGVREG
jgi:hypothetical protein|tara:strand:- start:421 stop:609 length:189 start_codon:yes stop_codon:yes gene_type:complete